MKKWELTAKENGKESVVEWQTQNWTSLTVASFFGF